MMKDIGELCAMSNTLISNENSFYVSIKNFSLSILYAPSVFHIGN